MNIDSDFDGGAIQVVRASAFDAIVLAIPHDTLAPDFRQWFAFRARGLGGKPARYTLQNAGEATYPDAFEGYRAAASYDRKRWFRVPTSFDGEALCIEHTPKTDDVVYAYFAPYPLDRHARLLKRAVRAPWARAEVLGKSVEGRDMTMLTFGEPGEGKLHVWVTARQHPGETMAEWFAEGLVERLLDEDDDVVREILERAVVRVVPNMNPDGGVHGNLRANAAGMNFNRAWLAPDGRRAPRCCACAKGCSTRGWTSSSTSTATRGTLTASSRAARATPGTPSASASSRTSSSRACAPRAGDFQDEYGYDRDEPGGGDLRTAGNWVGEEFDCLSYTLEMPFKDNANAPDEVNGWSPERSMHLGASTLESIRDSLDALRGEIDLPGAGDGDEGEGERDDEDDD